MLLNLFLIAAWGSWVAVGPHVNYHVLTSGTGHPARCSNVNAEFVGVETVEAVEMYYMCM